MLKILIFMLPILLFSKEITLEYLESKPRSVARDFYIWQFLKQNITPEEAKRAFELSYIKSTKIVDEYSKKTTDEAFLEQQKCYTLKDKQLLNQSYECLKVALSMSTILGTNKNILSELIPTIKPNSPQLGSTLEIFTTKYPISALLASDAETFLYVFNRLPNSFVEKHLNLDYSKEFLDKLAKKDKFDDFVKFVVFNDNMTKVQNALLNIDTNTSSDISNFYLAMNSIKQRKLDNAKIYLTFSAQNAKKRFEKDQALYWLYLVTNDIKYLAEIIKDSFDTNIYVLSAYELFGREPTNIITSVVTNQKERVFDESDPFEWLNFLDNYNKTKDIENATRNLNYKNTENFLVFILERHNNFKFDYFIMPYREYMENKTSDRIATLYAIAKQESNFIPTAISTSYAIGLMQIMPFLAEHIAKDLKLNIGLEDMFKPELSIKFADYHLDHDLKSLKHPLFIAYAYNGGIGFTRKIIKNGLFKNRNRFEPFFSMEMVPYEESRKYGKKVLANYIVYKKLLGESIKPSAVLQSAIEFSQNLYGQN